ncbi:STAS domain-containing protein [Micromonospora sp. CB01531]|uniref:STAS domain-containing protein n=1 Tax=Micromonospora sp. CB01531 TaxID=1718947 RepID=UPI00093E38F9|nr:STAS domain-containing protein [Micromonospora sp. CB01531]OKI61287.1 hypothetical protein A6A27_28440 [Micromonospora sp. CB01531]
MPPELLTIEVDRLDPARARLRLTGDLDFDTAAEPVAAAADLRRDGIRELLIDFGGVGLCDSSGLSALVVIHRTGLGEVLAAPPTMTDETRDVG